MGELQCGGVAVWGNCIVGELQCGGSLGVGDWRSGPLEILCFIAKEQLKTHEMFGIPVIAILLMDVLHISLNSSRLYIIIVLI